MIELQRLLKIKEDELRRALMNPGMEVILHFLESLPTTTVSPEYIQRCKELYQSESSLRAFTVSYYATHKDHQQSLHAASTLLDNDFFLTQPDVPPADVPTVPPVTIITKRPRPTTLRSTCWKDALFEFFDVVQEPYNAFLMYFSGKVTRETMQWISSECGLALSLLEDGFEFADDYDRILMVQTSPPKSIVPVIKNSPPQKKKSKCRGKKIPPSS